MGIPATTVQISDSDYPAGNHPEKLEVLFNTAPQYGTLTDKNGQPVSGRVAFSLFPLTYTPTQPSVFHVEKITFSVVDADDPDGIVSNTQTLEIVSGAITYGFSLQPGWNLVSFPLDPYPFDADPVEFFKSNDASVILGLVWEWDIVNRCLYPATALTGGKGYIVYAQAAADVQGMLGRSRANGQISVTPGWNLAGPSGSGTVAGIPPVIAGRIWYWYQPRNMLLPLESNMATGKAYWFHVPAGINSLDLSLH